MAPGSCPREILARLGVASDEEVLRIRRLRLIGKRPIGYEESYVPAPVDKPYTHYELSGVQLIDAIENRARVLFDEASETIEAGLADPETAGLLRVVTGSPVLVVRLAYRLASGVTGCVSMNRYPSHVLRFEISLVRQGPDRHEWEATTRDWL